MEDGYSEGEIFTVLFQMLLKKDNILYKLNSGELIIGRRGPQLTDEEYLALFGRHLEQDAVDQYQYDMEQALVDSVCVYTRPELSRKDLIKIKKGELENNEIKNLFNDCLGILNTKFNVQEDVQKVEKNPVEAAPTESEPTLQKKQEEQNEIADLVVKKLIEKLNKEENSQLKNEIADLVVKKLEEKDSTLSIPLAPTLPTDIFF